MREVSYLIGSVKKACQIISCFTNEEPALGIGEIATRLGMNISTTHHWLVHSAMKAF